MRITMPSMLLKKQKTDITGAPLLTAKLDYQSTHWSKAVTQGTEKLNRTKLRTQVLHACPRTQVTRVML